MQGAVWHRVPKIYNARRQTVSFSIPEFMRLKVGDELIVLHEYKKYQLWRGLVTEDMLASAKPFDGFVVVCYREE